MKKYFKLSDFGVIFSTRTRANEISDNLNKYAQSLSDDDILLIDFTKVEAISYSFFDQFINNITDFPSLNEKSISITGWTNDLLRVIDRSLNHRHCQYSSTNSGRILVLSH